jgi:hypothetical protein
VSQATALIKKVLTTPALQAASLLSRQAFGSNLAVITPMGIMQMKTKKNIFVTVLLSLAMLGTAAAAGNAPELPRTLANARFVYVTAYDGDQFDPQLLPDDRVAIARVAIARVAIARVQDAIQKWGKLTVVYRPQDADIILAVESRPSEDVLAVYDAHSGDAQSGPSQTYLWRVMGRAVGCRRVRSRCFRSLRRLGTRSRNEDGTSSPSGLPELFGWRLARSVANVYNSQRENKQYKISTVYAVIAWVPA